MMRLAKILLRYISILSIGGTVLFFRPAPSSAPTLPAKAYDMEAGLYAPLVQKLVNDGYPLEELQPLFSPGNDVFYERLTKINLVHREHPNPYKKMYNDRAITAISEYIDKHQQFFEKIRQEYGVDPGIIGAILYVESRFGRSSGDHPVLYVLSSMTLAPEEWSIQALIDDMDEEFPNLNPSERDDKIDYLRRRAAIKANWAYRELSQLLEIRRSHDIAIQQLQGSWAGAFGIPQFMPSSFKAYAVDGNADGDIDITESYDAIASVANYLYRNGWRGRLTSSKKRKAIWRYNHSQPYVDLIVNLADSVES